MLNEALWPIKAVSVTFSDHSGSSGYPFHVIILILTYTNILIPLRSPLRRF